MIEKKNIDIERIKNVDVFKVPDNYFDTITERVMARIDAEGNKVISINEHKQKKSWWMWSSVAACIAIVFVGTTFLGKNTERDINNTAEINYEEFMSQEEMIEYTMLDRDDIYCYLSGDEY